MPGAGFSGSGILGQSDDASSFLSGTVSPGEIISLYGIGIGPSPAPSGSLTATGTISMTFGDTQVLFDGIAAPILYASADQINVIVPFEVAGQESTRSRSQRHCSLYRV